MDLKEKLYVFKPPSKKKKKNEPAVNTNNRNSLQAPYRYLSVRNTERLIPCICSEESNNLIVQKFQNIF